MQPAELDILREGIVAIARAAAQEILVVYGGEFAVQQMHLDGRALISRQRGNRLHGSGYFYRFVCC